MLTEKQQQIVDSLVSEFTKMNTPVNTGKKGLLDWDEIYSEKEEWERTKAEINLNNKAFIDNAQLEMERITEMLEREFEDHFYIYHPTNNNINYGWSWCIVPHEKHWHNSLVNIDMNFIYQTIFDKSKTSPANRIDGLYFNSSATDKKYNSIEELFRDKLVINKFKSHLNK